MRHLDLWSQDAALNCRDILSGDGLLDTKQLTYIAHFVTVLAAYLDRHQDTFLLPAPEG